MSVRPRSTPHPVKLRVTVTDPPGLQRVLTMLTGRNQPFTRFAAEEAAGGRWDLRLDLTADPDEVALLEARLHRLPCVLAVEVRSGHELAVPA